MLQKGRGVLQSPSRSPVFSHQKEHMKHNRMIETQESIRLAVIGISQCHPFLISVSGSRLPQRPVACAIELVSRSAPTPGAGSLWNQPLRWGGPVCRPPTEADVTLRRSVRWLSHADRCVAPETSGGCGGLGHFWGYCSTLVGSSTIVGKQVVLQVGYGTGPFGLDKLPI